MAEWVLFILILFLVATLMRVEFVFTIAYLFFGILVLGRWSVRHTLQRVSWRRHFTDHAFVGESVPVRLEIVNDGLLPLPWLRLRDNLPLRLHVPSFFEGVVSLIPRERVSLEYELICSHRGYYPLGPLALRTGDLFGVAEKAIQEETGDYLTVYPKIVPLPGLDLPSQSPFGTLPSRQRLFEDPTRVCGVRDYLPGDSLRRMDWKTSAAIGKLQVKRFQPAISLEAVIFLNLNAGEYRIKCRFSAPELGIVTAASIAHHLVERRQAVGIVTNGCDPLAEPMRLVRLPPRKGRDYLMRLLEVLARVQVHDTSAFVDTLQQGSLGLSWGTTLVIITAQETENLFDILLQLRRRGFHLVLVLLDPAADFRRTRQRAQQVGVHAYHICHERDLDVWR